MFKKQASTTILILFILKFVSLLLFSYGFFPTRTGTITAEQNGSIFNFFKRMENFDDGSCGKKLRALLENEAYEKVVIIVIDAWKAGFYHKHRETMPFLSSVQDAGIAKVFNAHVQSPTVTMPRIKALTEGIVPSFADVVYNFASSEIVDDNIIDQLKFNGKRLAFCGDNTWLQLFPGRFDARSEGTTSFFVNDYVEVDNNVTRCATQFFSEEANKEWDVMILHYLGLDHIGHSLGGTHPQINIKLIEMDNIIKKIYSSLKFLVNRNFTLIVVGDHGMTDNGGHGGSSTDETHVTLAIIDDVEQIDIVPTLAFFANTPIPVNSIGVTLLDRLISSRVGTQNQFKILLSLLLNSIQLQRMRKFAANEETLNVCIERVFKLLKTMCQGRVSNNEQYQRTFEYCKKGLITHQAELLSSQSNFDLPVTTIAIAISFTSKLYSFVAISVTLYYCVNFFQRVCGSMSRTANLTRETDSCTRSLGTFGIFLAIHVISSFASSLIEEEHDVQYFLFTSVLFFSLIRFECRYRLNRSMTAVKDNSDKNMMTWLIHKVLKDSRMHRLCRGFTDGSRRRWIAEADLLSVNRGRSVPTFFIVTVAVIVIVIILYGDFLILLEMELSFYEYMTGVGSNFTWDFRTFFERTSWWGILIGIGLTVAVSKQACLGIFIWALFLSPREQFSLRFLNCIVGVIVSRVDGDGMILYLALMCSFFYSGNSNSLATVDVSAGFIGLQSYQPLVIGTQIFLNTYAGPISTLSSYLSCGEHANDKSAFAIFAMFTKLSLDLFSLLLFKHHLFAWTVFAPAFVYHITHFLFLFIIVTAATIYVLLANH
uniref:GPI ethanolamine phosphate transferase 2 n=1 Tax=Syphacia muris TaxID=451379 RepID=A0A0N5A9F2_9BILA